MSQNILNNNNNGSNATNNLKTLASKSNLEMKDLSTLRKAGQGRNNNYSISNLNTLFGSSNNNGNNKTNFLNHFNNNQNDIGADLTNIGMISEKNSNLVNNNLKAIKDQNINNINISNKTNNIYVGNLNDERDKNLLKDKDTVLNLQSKKTIEIKAQEKQQQITDKGKLKEIEDKLNKIYSNCI